MHGSQVLRVVCGIIESVGWLAAAGGPLATILGVAAGPPLPFPLRGIDRPLFVLVFIAALVLSALLGLLLVATGEAGRLFARMGDRLGEVHTLLRAQGDQRREQGGPEWARLS